MSFTFEPEGDVVIIGRLSGGADAIEIAEEPVALHCPGMVPINMRSVTAVDDELRATCLIADLPPALGADLELYGTINPPGCRLNLAGMSLGIYPLLSTETIEALDARLKRAIEAVARAIDEANTQGASI